MSKVLLEQARRAGEVERHDEPTNGGAFLIEEGRCPARLIGYIELGKHEQGEYNGTVRDPATEVQLVFECFGKNSRQIEVDGKKVTAGSIFRPYTMTKSLSSKSNFYKLFMQMDNGRGHGNLAEMLDEVFLLDIEHAETKAKRKYAKLKSISSPIIEEYDELGNVTGTRNIGDKVPPAQSPHQLLLLKEPTMDQWDSIFIEGTYKKKVKGEDGKETEVEVSKNFIQEKVKSALDWEGSPMQALLLGVANEEVKPEPVKEEPKEVKEEPKQETVAAQDDLMAELGLE